MEMKSSLVTLKPGMYILRHPKGGLPPLSISRAPGGNGQFEVLATPRTQGSILRDGSDCIVMRVFDAPIEVLVTAYVEHAGVAAPALRVDQIGLDAAPSAAAQQAAPANGAKPIVINGTGISVIGHIERTGDIVASEGQQLGQAGSNLRLEGFQVMWPDKPAGLDLTYGLTLEGGEATPMVSVGQFCGTRNKARRITEVTFSLAGAQAQQYQLDGLAHFSGGFQTPIVSGLTISGPSGLEHLTSISLRAIAAVDTPQHKHNPWDASPRTQVFKAPSKVAKTPAVKTSAKKVLEKPPAVKEKTSPKAR